MAVTSATMRMAVYNAPDSMITSKTGQRLLWARLIPVFLASRSTVHILYARSAKPVVRDGQCVHKQIRRTRCGAICNESEDVNQRSSLSVDDTTREHVKDVHYTPCVIFSVA